METAEATATEVASEVVEVAPAAVGAIIIEDKGVCGGGSGDPSDVSAGIGVAAGESTLHCPTEVAALAAVSVMPAPAPGQLDASATGTSDPEAVPEMAAVTVETAPTTAASSAETTPAAPTTSASGDVEQLLPAGDLSESAAVMVTAVVNPVEPTKPEPAVEGSALEARTSSGTQHQAEGPMVVESFSTEEAFPSEGGKNASATPPTAAVASLSASAAFASAVGDPSPAEQVVPEPLEIGAGSPNAPQQPESTALSGSVRGVLPGAVTTTEFGEPRADDGPDEGNIAELSGDADAPTVTTAMTATMSAHEATEGVSGSGSTEPAVVVNGFSAVEQNGHAQGELVSRLQTEETAGAGMLTEEEGSAPKGVSETRTNLCEAPAAFTMSTAATLSAAPATSDTPAASIAPESSHASAPEPDDAPYTADTSFPSDPPVPAVASESVASPAAFHASATSTAPDVPTASASAVEVEKAGVVTEEMKAFLEDSETEAEGETGPRAQDTETTLAGRVALTVETGLDGEYDVDDLLEPGGEYNVHGTRGVDLDDDLFEDEPQEPQRIHGPRSPTHDTEFSARHAQRIIGPGVVLERKASISAVAVELKNKSEFSAEDAMATIKSGAISERTRLLKEEQEALKAKHATERQDTDLPNLSKTIIRQGSVKGKSQMYQQALSEGDADKNSKPAPAPRRRLNADWTQRRDSYDEYVVQYVPPPLPENATVESGGTSNTTTGEGPVRYLPRPKESDVGPTSSRSTSRGNSFGSGNVGINNSEAKPKLSSSGSAGSIGATKSGAERSKGPGKSNVIEEKALATSNEETRPSKADGAVQEKDVTTTTEVSAPNIDKSDKDVVKKEEVDKGKELAAPPREKAPAVTAGNGGEVESIQTTKLEVSRSSAGNGVASISSASAPAPAVDRVVPATNTSGGCCVVS